MWKGTFSCACAGLQAVRSVCRLPYLWSLLSFFGLQSLMLASVCHAQSLKIVTETAEGVYLQNGKVAGPVTQVVELALQRANLRDYRIFIYPWARSYEIALREPNVLIYRLARTPARESQFKWVAEFNRVQASFYKLKERSDIVVKSMVQAKQYTIGIIREDFRHQYLLQQGFSRLALSAEMAENFRHLLVGKVDLLLLNQDDVSYLCQSNDFDCARLERQFVVQDLQLSSYLAASKNTPDSVVQRLDEAFKLIKADGSFQKIMGKQ